MQDSEHRSVCQILDQVSNQYRDRLLKEGKLNQSSSEIFQELQTIREQIAVQKLRVPRSLSNTTGIPTGNAAFSPS
jgi:hypothetical protein